MRVKIIRPTIAQKRQVMPGDELEVSKEEAQQLILANKAVPVREIPIETAMLPIEVGEVTMVSVGEKPKGYTKKKASE